LDVLIRTTQTGRIHPAATAAGILLGFL